MLAGGGRGRDAGYPAPPHRSADGAYIVVYVCDTGDGVAIRSGHGSARVVHG